MIREHSADRRLVLLGEKHGTEEAPQLATALLEEWSMQGPVWLALEAWQVDQPLYDAYLQSGCAASQRRALHAGSFWHIDHDRHDGRRNQAALALIDAACRLHADGRPIGILAFDPGPANRGDHHDRSQRMADAIHARFKNLPANGRMLVLTGNVHAMIERPADAPPRMQIPMGQRLRAMGLDPLGIDLLARAGAFPACRSPHACELIPVQLSERVHSGPTAGGPHHLRVVLDRFTPARLLGTPPGTPRTQEQPST